MFNNVRETPVCNWEDVPWDWKTHKEWALHSFVWAKIKRGGEGKRKEAGTYKDPSYLSAKHIIQFPFWYNRNNKMNLKICNNSKNKMYNCETVERTHIKK